MGLQWWWAGKRHLEDDRCRQELEKAGREWIAGRLARPHWYRRIEVKSECAVCADRSGREHGNRRRRGVSRRGRDCQSDTDANAGPSGVYDAIPFTNSGTTGSEEIRGLAIRR